MAPDLSNLTWAAWGLGLMSCALLAAVLTLAWAVQRLHHRVARLEEAGQDLPGPDW